MAVNNNNFNEIVQLLKYIKSLKGDYQNFVQHTNSRDIDTITICCANLLKDNIPLTLSKKKSIKKSSFPYRKGYKECIKQAVKEEIPHFFKGLQTDCFHDGELL